MLEATNELGNAVLSTAGTLTDPSAAAALAVGLAALGAGYAERREPDSEGCCGARISQRSSSGQYGIPEFVGSFKHW